MIQIMINIIDKNFLKTQGHPGITLIICAAIMASSLMAYAAATIVRKRYNPSRIGYQSIS